MNRDKTGSFIENVIFDNKIVFLMIIGIISCFLGYHALGLKFNAAFEKMIPLKHPYVLSYYEHIDDVEGGNFIQIAVETTSGDIFDVDYLEQLKEISDAAFFLPGVDRATMKSLWTKNVQWRAVTEDGIEGGVVISDEYDGTDRTLSVVRANTLRSGQVGKLVANNFKSTIIHLPLMEVNPETGAKLDYSDLSKSIEDIREKYSSETVKLHVIGFAKLMGVLIDGVSFVAAFFAVASLLTLVLLFVYSRCISGTLLPITCSFIAVIWQLGFIKLLGFGLNPYSILVPFLVFAIGVSHGVQMVNAMAIEASQGYSKEESARRTFRDLASAGLTALLSDALGFITLLFIQIKVIQELGIGASIGVAAIIATNLLLLPILLSYAGITKSGIEHATKKEDKPDRISAVLSHVTAPKPARGMLVVALALVVVGLFGSQGIKIGDIDKGAPELRPDSEYNQDVDFVVSNYSVSSDVMILMVETGDYKCVAYETLDLMDKLQWKLQHVNGVQSVDSAANRAKRMGVLLNEGNSRMYGIPRDQSAIFSNVKSLPEGAYFNNECDLSKIVIALDDHKAETLDRVVAAIEEFNGENEGVDMSFVLAAGNAGIAAATNQEIKKAQMTMLLTVYLVVIAMVIVTFRSVSAVVCIIVPLAITSLLSQALMAYLGIGVKVATLPVIAMGVGIGVDYGIYIYNRIQHFLSQGLSLSEAYMKTLRTTGKAVTFTGITLAVGVCTWILSPIKFQADMGLLLTFMFLWNMIGAMTLLPALAYFLNPKVTTKDAEQGSKSLSMESAGARNQEELQGGKLLVDNI